MVSATASTQASVPNLVLNMPTTSASINSFPRQLATTLEQYFGQSQNGSQLELDIQPVSTSGSSSGQFMLTVKPAQQANTVMSPTAANPGATAVSLSSQPANDYVQVPFGNSTMTVPSLATTLARQEAMMTFMTPAAILNQDALSAAGDPMAGKSVPGTNLNWDDLTQDQQLAYFYAMNYGVPGGQSMQAYLNANQGPHIMANAPSKNPTLFGDA